MFSVTAGAAVIAGVARAFARRKQNLERTFRRPAPSPRPHLLSGGTMSVVPTDETSERERLRLLSGSTRLQIGLSFALAAASLGLALSGHGRRPVTPHAVWADVAARAFVIAAFAGSVIAASCPYYTSFTRLMADRILPFYGRGRADGPVLIPTGRAWVRIQHAAFWIGVVAALVSFGMRPFELGIPARGLVTDGTTGGYTMVLEWHVSGPALQRLADFGADRAVLVCTESEGGIELQVDQVGGKKHVVKVGGPGEFTCHGLPGHAVFARSRDGEPQSGKLFVR